MAKNSGSTRNSDRANSNRYVNGAILADGRKWVWKEGYTPTAKQIQKLQEEEQNYIARVAEMEAARKARDAAQSSESVEVRRAAEKAFNRAEVKWVMADQDFADAKNRAGGWF